MSLRKLTALFRLLDNKSNAAREAALYEIRELKADLSELERYLQGRKKQTDIQPEDFIRSSYEIAAQLREIRQRDAVAEELKDESARVDAEEYLESRGAKFLKRPAGWHWTSSRDERFLLHEHNPLLAADELRKLLASGKKRKKTKKK